MLLYAEKYHNVKKNLMRVADKIDSSETIYFAFNPLIEKQINVPITFTKNAEISMTGLSEVQVLEIVAAFY
jgi:hypothetical protein